jgi:hypothetical protein
MVYNHLSLLYETVHRSFDGASAAALGGPPTPHPYMALVKDHAAPFTARAMPFELWPKALVADLTRRLPTSTTRFPRGLGPPPVASPPMCD